MKILLKVLITAVAVWASTLLPNIDLGNASVAKKVITILAVAVIFGVINAVIKPVIKVVGCAFYLLTLGLIALVVNAGLFWLSSWIAGQLDLPFHVDGFWAAFWGALIVGVVSFVLHLVVPDRDDD